MHGTVELSPLLLWLQNYNSVFLTSNLRCTSSTDITIHEEPETTTLIQFDCVQISLWALLSGLPHLIEVIYFILLLFDVNRPLPPFYKQKSTQSNCQPVPDMHESEHDGKDELKEFADSAKADQTN